MRNTLYKQNETEHKLKILEVLHDIGAPASTIQIAKQFGFSWSYTEKILNILLSENKVVMNRVATIKVWEER